MGWTVKGITDRQRLALEHLASIVPASAYLGGGVAVSTIVGHRTSEDLDVFVRGDDPSRFVDALARLPRTRIIGRSEGTVHLEIEGIPTSLLRYDYPILSPPHSVAGIAVPVAGVLDLICMKLSAIAGGGSMRDFWDFHELLGHEEALSLPDALQAFQRKYSAFDIGHVIKSLVYFADADAEPLPRGLDESLWAAIKEDLLRRVSEL